MLDSSPKSNSPGFTIGSAPVCTSKLYINPLATLKDEYLISPFLWHFGLYLFKLCLALMEQICSSMKRHFSKEILFTGFIQYYFYCSNLQKGISMKVFVSNDCELSVK